MSSLIGNLSECGELNDSATIIINMEWLNSEVGYASLKHNYFGFLYLIIDVISTV